MANRHLTADVIASEAVMILDNNLVMGKLVHRAEDEFSKSVNGYKVGDTVNFRKPAQFEVRTGATAAPQDVQEGKIALQVATQAGVDIQFTSAELTMNIDDLSKRVIKPAMVRLANYLDAQIWNLYKEVPAWVGTAGQTINSFADFAVGAQWLDDHAVPQDERFAALSPTDYWAMMGSQTALYINEAAKGAYRDGSLGLIGGIDTYMSQNAPSHTVGADAGGTVNQALVDGTVVYSSVRDADQYSLTTSSWTGAEGDVFAITDVLDVNPVTKAPLTNAKQFRVVTATASNVTVISPAPIFSGAFQNCAFASGVSDANSKAITSVGTAATAYRQNLMGHKNWAALACVPMEKPAGATDVARKTYKGLSVRVIPYYDGANDVSNYRLDMLFGLKAIDPRLACRISGT
jgi:hypothetical protein